ncbi:MAG: hypothetical protein M0Z53_02555 [Thermaerobacter sp.]|nr:hypothetical protein [Thermaerobacter sp.]
MAERLEQSTANPAVDAQRILITVPDPGRPRGGELLAVGIARDALQQIMLNDPRPPEILLPLIAERAIRRMPVPNGTDGQRLITAYNLSLVWPS